MVHYLTIMYIYIIYIYIHDSREHAFVDIGKQETCAKFQQKLLNSIVVGALQIF